MVNYGCWLNLILNYKVPSGVNATVKIKNAIKIKAVSEKREV